MRKYIIAGNWKMQKDLSEAIQLVSELKSELAGKTLNAEVVIAPPYISIIRRAIPFAVLRPSPSSA